MKEQEETVETVSCDYASVFPQLKLGVNEKVWVCDSRGKMSEYFSICE
jgi:hypothetical protein